MALVGFEKGGAKGAKAGLVVRVEVAPDVAEPFDGLENGLGGCVALGLDFGVGSASGHVCAASGVEGEGDGGRQALADVAPGAFYGFEGKAYGMQVPRAVEVSAAEQVGGADNGVFRGVNAVFEKVVENVCGVGGLVVAPEAADGAVGGLFKGGAGERVGLGHGGEEVGGVVERVAAEQCSGGVGAGDPSGVDHGSQGIGVGAVIGASLGAALGLSGAGHQDRGDGLASGGRIAEIAMDDAGGGGVGGLVAAIVEGLFGESGEVGFLFGN